VGRVVGFGRLVAAGIVGDGLDGQGSKVDCGGFGSNGIGGILGFGSGGKGALGIGGRGGNVGKLQ